MSNATLEHANITVSDPLKTAKRLCDLFGWHIRWQGDAIHGGMTVHVGSDDSYLALYHARQAHRSHDQQLHDDGRAQPCRHRCR